MPAINTSGLNDGQTERYVREAYKEVDTGARVGIIEERNTGVVPVYVDKAPAYKGVTEFRPVYKKDGMGVESRRVGISGSMPTYARVGKKTINDVKRTARHEFRHVLSETLLNYMDVSPNVRTLIMESYAEFAGIKGGTEEKEDVLLTTPYHGAVKFGYFADRFYQSKLDGKVGYAGFIRDIQRYQSAREALRNLGSNIKEAVGRGVDVAKLAEADYRSDVMDAARKVGLKPGYARAA